MDSTQFEKKNKFQIIFTFVKVFDSRFMYVTYNCAILLTRVITYFRDLASIQSIYWWPVNVVVTLFINIDTAFGRWWHPEFSNTALICALIILIHGSEIECLDVKARFPHCREVASDMLAISLQWSQGTRKERQTNRQKQRDENTNKQRNKQLHMRSTQIN